MDYSKDQFNCPVEATLFLIGGKYKPPRTLYSLTSFGCGMIPVLNAMRDWDAGFLDGLDIQPPCRAKNQQENPDWLSCFGER